jgi:hypothetical protein
MEPRPPWSDRRRRTLLALAGGMMAFTLGGIGFSGEVGATSAILAALCAFLFLVATIVFIAVPGPGTLGTLLRSVPLAGAVLVVAVLLLLSTPEDLRWLWIAGTVGAAAWTGTALWEARRTRSPSDGGP